MNHSAHWDRPADWSESNIKIANSLSKIMLTDQQKLLVHFVVSKLVILAVPLLNQILAFAGITVNTSNSTVDALANCLCIAIGLAYSYWAKTKAQEVHTNAGFNQGVKAVTGVDPSTVLSTTKIVPSVLEIPFDKPSSAPSVTSTTTPPIKDSYDK